MTGGLYNRASNTTYSLLGGTNQKKNERKANPWWAGGGDEQPMEGRRSAVGKMRTQSRRLTGTGEARTL